MLPALGAGLLTGGMGLIGTMMTNSANAKQVAQQMDFQERMSGTAHQREVADLKAAGLNPALSGMGGAGASSPMGAAATMENPGESAARGVSSALEATRLKKEIGAADSQIELNKASEARQKADANSARANADNLDMDTFKKSFNVNTAAAAEKAELMLRKGEADAGLKYLKADQIMKRVGQGVSTAADAASIIPRLRGLPMPTLRGPMGERGRGIRENIGTHSK